MNTKEFLQSNLERFARIQPPAAIHIQNAYSDHITPSKTSLDKPNLLINTGEKEFPLHALKDAKEEIEKACLPIDDPVEILYFYGVGLGYPFDAFKEWLKADKSHQLVFLEDDPAILMKLFETPYGKEILEHPQVYLYFIQTEGNNQPLYDQLTWRFLSKPFTFRSLPSYKQFKSSSYEEIEKEITYKHHRKNEAIEEYLDHGITFFRNFYANLLELPYANKGNALFDKFKGIPAIICGAGPSLEKQLPLLEKLKDRALIFAGGSSLLALSRSGIHPHFAAGIDPNSPHYQRLLNHTAFNVPYFYRSRIYAPALRTVHGPRLYLNGTGGYDTALWVEEQLGIEGEAISEGNNIVNFMTAIAHALGCGPIIFVGLDLAYTGDELYSKSVMTTETMTQSTFAHQAKDSDETTLTTDIFGKPIRTHYKWLAEARWITRFADEHPDAELINATEGGMGAENIPNTSFSELIDKRLTKTYDLESKVNNEVDKSQLPEVTTETVQTVLNTLRSSLETCTGILTKLLDELKRLAEQPEDPFPSPSMALLESELMDQEAYFAVLAVFDKIYQHVQLGERHDLIHLSEEAQRSRQLELDTRSYVFLRETARSNIALIDQALEEGSSLQPKEEQKIIPDSIPKKDEKIHGTVYLYYPNGQLHRQTEFDHGKRHGRDALWYRNGELELEAFYDHDTPYKSLLHYYPNGQIAEEVRYHTCPAHYDIRKWNSEGQLMVECLYDKNGTCLYKEWDQEGNLRSEKQGVFKNNRLIFN